MPAHPDQAVFFIENLKHDRGKWAGRPFKLLPFQDEFTRKVFELDKKGRRKVQRSLFGIARKNGKSTWGAALALTLLVCDGERGGEVIGAAAKKEQAKIIMETAKRMVRYSNINGVPLSKYLTIRRDGIYFPELDSRYIVVSADGEKEHGLNPHAVIIDEWHALGMRRDLIDALVTAQGARENPLLIGLTTAGPSPKGSCYEEYRYMQQVNSGVINDPQFHGVWHEADKSLDIDNPLAWEQANPAIDTAVSRPWLAKQAADVLSGRLPEYTFRRLHLNQWTTALERWLPRKKWEACGGPPDFTDGQEITIALDAALRRDSFGVAMVGRSRGWIDGEDGLTIPADVANVRVRAFIPEEEGEYIDQEDVRIFLMGLSGLYRIKKVLYDPAYMTLFAQQLSDAGLPMEPFPQQGEKMVEATETLQKMVITERVRHGNERVLDEQLAGVAVSETERGVRISKRKSADRIDTVIAMIMALHEEFGDDGGDEETYFAGIA